MRPGSRFSILKGARNLDNAKLFIDELARRQGLSGLAEKAARPQG